MFEIRPVWRLVWIYASHGFDHKASRIALVRNVSNVRRQLSVCRAEHEALTSEPQPIRGFIVYPIHPRLSASALIGPESLIAGGRHYRIDSTPDSPIGLVAYRRASCPSSPMAGPETVP
jgi:hypothetical protein